MSSFSQNKRARIRMVVDAGFRARKKYYEKLYESKQRIAANALANKRCGHCNSLMSSVSTSFFCRKCKRFYSFKQRKQRLSKNWIY